MWLDEEGTIAARKAHREELIDSGALVDIGNHG
jgi:hypothetical protein